MEFLLKIQILVFVTACLLFRGSLSKSSFNMVKENENTWTNDNSMEQAMENDFRKIEPWSWGSNRRFWLPGNLGLLTERQDEDERELLPLQMKKKRNLNDDNDQRIAPFKLMLHHNFNLGQFKKRKPLKTIRYSQCYFNPISCFSY